MATVLGSLLACVAGRMRVDCALNAFLQHSILMISLMIGSHKVISVEDILNFCVFISFPLFCKALLLCEQLYP